MKQGGKKKPVQTTKIEENGDKLLSVECKPCLKRRKISDSDEKDEKLNESLTNGSNKRWSVVETDVEPEILEDMGVSMLEDEGACDGQKVLKNSVEQESETSSPICESVMVSNDNESSPQPVQQDKSVDHRKSNELSEDFFLYRRKQPVLPKGEDVFLKLSDEMVLMIFRWLPKNMLVRCSLVCKRWQRIAYDEVLWTRMDLGSRTLNSGSLGHVLTRGTTILRLAQAEISDPVFFSNCSILIKDVPCKLQYLDLSMAIISEEGLADLLSTCKNLRKLSLEHCRLNDKACAAIGQNYNLDTLNMSACYGITEACVSNILTGCRKLSALNVAWTDLSVAALNILCTKLPRSMQRINISGCRKTLTDNHLRQLVASCPDLVELDLSDCTTLTAESINIITNLDKIEYLALSRCYSIAPAAYLLLSSVNSLMYLDVFNLMSEQSVANLQENLPDVDVNKFLFSSVARPTVGIRRTSIWGLRVRD
ncbi:S-phase kinase-associated protein 2 isoform X2 [Zootermopsis nevadensis]|uniref:S-phase kinase-associated protein 2 n=2 Tax=Zootermopsis nevadensis TaxID=136037 RepID=A0A067RBG1_ZOONE|nr:S-phase kinase-associated protein 2 isoform X2 [Zootermopsis nevadensis]KDR21087.1 S-phase kinase-associated protein 2 [Zootermopsis nevadensis]